MPEAHARFSPSAAHRWVRCPASIKLSEGFNDTGSEAADEGTAAHFLASECLSNDRDTEFYLGKRIGVANEAFWMIPKVEYEGSFREFAVDVDMCAYVQQYLDYVRMLASKGSMLVEQRLDLSSTLGQPDQFGTSDAVVLAGSTLHVVDLKYGRGNKVTADENEQGILYMLGAHNMLRHIDAIEDVVFVVHQPRLDHVDEWRITVDELLARRTQFVDAAENALSEDPRCIPGEKQCQWCPAVADCAAAAKKVQETVDEDFENMDEDKVVDNVNHLSGNIPAFEEGYASLGFVENWCKAMRDRGLALALNGDLTCFKAVTGRRGARAWEDAEAAEKAMKAARVKVEDMYDRKLISPTTAEKRLKAKRKLWPQLKGMVVQPEGKPTVVPIGDPREAISNKANADDFDNMDEKEKVNDLL